MGSPKLRFPEYHQAWHQQIIGEFIEDFQQKSVVQDEYVVLTSARAGLIKQADYYENSRITERENIGYNIVPPSYLTYRSRSDDRQFFFNENHYDETGIISHFYPVFRIVNGSNKFFKELFARHRFHIGKFAVGTSQTVLSHRTLKEIKLSIPCAEEQKKIADFLGAVDDKIAALRERERLLTDYKKGVMQKIFTQALRFKADDGSDFPEWEKRIFGEVFERVVRKNTENNKNVLTISAQQGLLNQEEYFNKSVAAKDVTGYYLIERGEFAYNKSYSKGYPMGALKRLTRYDQGVVSTLYICFVSRTQTCEEFYEHYFEGGLLNHELHKIAQEGARNHGLLNLSVIEFFRDMLIDYPHPEEQQKIAEFLSAIDEKITAVSAQIIQMQDFKKGLLQQMFV